MAKFEITSPDGTRYEISAPEGATQEQVLAYAQQQFAGASAEKPTPTIMDRVNAAVGGVNRGMVGLAGLPMDTVQNVYNLGKAAIGTAATAAGRPDLAPPLTQGTPLSSEWIERQLRERAGVATAPPRPDDPASRMLSTAGTIAGSSVVPGATVKNALTAAAGGALAGETLGPQYTGLGAMAPAAVGAAAGAAKNAVANRAAPAVEEFKAVGSMPSVGQVTNNSFLTGLENLASKFPGGAGIMKRFIEGQQRQIGSSTKTGVSAESAGRTIEKGITGETGFIARTKAQWNALDDAVAAKVPQNTRVMPTNTEQVLERLTAIAPGAERTSASLVNPKLLEIRNNLKADREQPMRTLPLSDNSPGTYVNAPLPYSTLRALRSKVGSMLDDALVSDIPNGQLKQLYAAMSKDLEGAANAAGAGKQFAMQNNFYRARMERVESVLDRVVGKGKQPEDVFKAFMPTDPNQANKVRAVMRSLQPAERKIVSEAVVARLGNAKPGQQTDVGDVFSSQTFLTNWNRLSPGAKAQLFPDGAMRGNLDKIAKVASDIKADSGLYANPSGTAGSFAAYSVYLSPLAAVASGSAAPLVAAGTAAGSAFVGSKMLTSPKVVEWLATPVNPKSIQAAAHLARLAVIYNQTKDEALKGELSRFVQGIQPK